MPQRWPRCCLGSENAEGRANDGDWIGVGEGDTAARLPWRRRFRALARNRGVGGSQTGGDVTDHPIRFPRFYVTAESPCPYLPGRMERKVFTELRGPDAANMNEALGRIGFRRSQNVAYRPNCIGCSACVSVRIVADDLHLSRTQRRLLKRNADLEVTACDAVATEEQYQLLRQYLEARHPDGGMVSMDNYDFAEMVETSPIDTVVVEYRQRHADGSLGRLIGACLTDKQSDGLSMVYSFYDTSPDARPGLGTYIILDHTLRAARAGLSHVYLGYWVRGSRHMDYKRHFQPLEMLTAAGWQRMPDEIARVEPARSTESAPMESGPAKTAAGAPVLPAERMKRFAGEAG